MSESENGNGNENGNDNENGTDTDPASAGGWEEGDRQPGAAPAWDGFVAIETRPEGVPDNYWDKDKGGVKVGAMLKRLADQQRNIKDLENPAPRAPGEYTFNPPEHLAGHVSGDTPLGKRVFEWARKFDIPQAGADELVAAFYADLPTLDGLTEALAGPFGDHAAAVIRANDAWLRTFSDDGIRDALDTLVLTPDGHRALKLIRETMNGGRAIQDREAVSEAAQTEADVDERMADPRYWRDREPAFVRETTEMLKKVRGFES